MNEWEAQDTQTKSLPVFLLATAHLFLLLLLLQILDLVSFTEKCLFSACPIVY